MDETPCAEPRTEHCWHGARRSIATYVSATNAPPYAPQTSTREEYCCFCPLTREVDLVLVPTPEHGPWLRDRTYVPEVARE